jgi:hypothetical protein
LGASVGAFTFVQFLVLPTLGADKYIGFVVLYATGHVGVQERKFFIDFFSGWWLLLIDTPSA